MKRAALLIATVAALGLAAPAGASVTDADLAAVLPTAQAAWPDSACRGREVVHLNVDMEAAFPGQLAANGDHLGGIAYKATCEVWISATFTNRLYLCGILTHEFGHLALTGTDADHTETGIMSMNLTAYAPCAERFNSRTKTPRAWAESSFAPDTHCTFVTKRPGVRIYRCGHKARVIVYVTATGAVSGVDRF